MYLLIKCKFLEAVFELITPLLQMRLAMMAGDWGQYALFDELEPDSDFQSSITFIDLAVSKFSVQSIHCVPGAHRRPDWEGPDGNC